MRSNRQGRVPFLANRNQISLLLHPIRSQQPLLFVPKGDLSVDTRIEMRAFRRAVLTRPIRVSVIECNRIRSTRAP